MISVLQQPKQNKMKNSSQKISIPISFILICSIFASAQYAPVLRTDRYSDNFLYRTSAQFGIPLPQNIFNQPMDADAILRYLAALDSSGTPGLSSADRYSGTLLFNRISGKTAPIKWTARKKDRSLFLHINFPGEARLFLPEHAELRGRGIIAPRLEGNIGRLSYHMELDVWTEFRSDTIFPMSRYQPYDGVPYNLYGRADSSQFRSSDLPRGGIHYSTGHISLETGIDYLRQGPCVYNPLAFSGQAPPVTYGRARLDMGPAVYSHTAGLLKSQKDKPKYLYSHRLEFLIERFHLTAAIGEAIIYGSATDQPGDSLKPVYYGTERTWEWAYFIPFVPYKFVEHYNGDRDNASLSIDLNLMWPKNFRWYGEVFVDDMLSPLQFFTDDWGNKWAYTLGMQWFGAVLNKDVFAGIEFTRIEPWVYTHFYGGSHRYDNYNKTLGSQLGPNAYQLNVSCSVRPLKILETGPVFTLTGKGTDRGSHITDVFHYEATSTMLADSRIKQFMGTGSQTSVFAGINFKINTFGRLWADITAGYDSKDKLVFSMYEAVHF
jgi:hypothetical protein